MSQRFPPRPEPTPGSEEAYERYRRSGQHLAEFDIDPRERQQWQRQVRGAKLRQAAVLCWLLGSPFAVVPLFFGSSPWWVVAIIGAIVGVVVGYLLPVNVPPPRRPMLGGDNPYGVYDPRGPHAPRN